MMTSDVKRARVKLTAQERAYLIMGKDQAGGKLPLFDHEGQVINTQIIKACIHKGWAERWFSNPMKPDWLVCRLTPAGRKILR